MSRNTPEKVLRAVCVAMPALRQMMLPVYEKNNCIASVRLLKKLLDELGLICTPIPCELLLMNAAMVIYLNDNGSTDTDESTIMKQYEQLRLL